MGIFAKLKDGMQKTRKQITSIVGAPQSDEGLYQALEDALIAADVGVDLTAEIVERLKKEVARKHLATAAEVYTLLKEMLVADLRIDKMPDEYPPKPWVILVVGVNGVGKTTTIGKLSSELRAEGKAVMLGAADTFRAGAIEQLRIWAGRTGADFVAQQAGADAASVAFDALQAAQARGTDVLILDTAGRLHTKVNLMNELEKIVRVVKRHTPHAPNEALLVIDATTGQNALRQAQTFHKALGLTGMVITKLDGTAKGGIALALAKNLGIPIKKVGVGEGPDDLHDFDPAAFVDAMFGSIGE
jgi:fused signal recognition particle receptor